jgi:hypothetical protein
MWARESRFSNPDTDVSQKGRTGSKVELAASRDVGRLRQAGVLGRNAV